MEDVDCASRVVYARKGASAAAAAQAGSMLTAQSSKAKDAGESSGTPGLTNVSPMAVPLYRAQSEPPNPAQLKRNAPFSIPKLMRQVSKVAEHDQDRLGSGDGGDDATLHTESAEAAEEEEEEDEEEDEEPEGGEEELEREVAVEKASSGEKKKRSFLSDPQLDKLNLSGLLNVLDGVVDTPARVVVMTTNHPEKLDPALIRPGRINKRIHLGFVDAETLLLMAKHYICRDCDLPQHAAAEAERLCGSGRGITPAWVEQCSAESEDFDGFLRQLWVLKNAAVPGSKPTPAGPRRW